jgi:hypothetical protein
VPAAVEVGAVEHPIVVFVVVAELGAEIDDDPTGIFWG